MEGRRCRRCGGLLASDHQDDEWCSPCLETRRGYDPRYDPFFLDRLLYCLIESAPERVEPIKALGMRPEHRGAVRDAIRTLRRQGHAITASERFAGYRYSGEIRLTRVVTPCPPEG